jgi:HSP20 family protein
MAIRYQLSAENDRARRKIMTLVRWSDPFREFTQLQDRLSRVFSDAYGRSGADEGLMTTGAWVPPVDIYSNGDHELVLKAELPDLTREAIDITVDNGTLTIKGEKKLSGEVKEEQFHRIERRYGTFSRSFSLPQTVDPGKVSAEYTNGVLTVRLPLREEAKPRQIKVDVAA